MHNAGRSLGEAVTHSLNGLPQPPESQVFRSFFPEPKIFFPAAVIWTALVMAIWFSPLGAILENALSLGPWLGMKASAADPTPFLDTHKIWLYEYIIVTGYLFCIPWYFIGGNRRWFWWSCVGSVTIIEFVYFDVQISAWLNSWYGGFYDLVQNAMGKPNSVSLDQYGNYIWSVAIVLSVDVVFAILNSFLNSHYLFRWRRAMSFYYLANWQKLRGVEGSAQRIQEDTQQFASILEGLGLSLVSSVMTLIVFLPLLFTLSTNIKIYPVIGALPGGLVWIAVVSALFGTVLLAAVGVKLPGLTFQNQRVEAAYRKELVLGEDYAERATPPTVRECSSTCSGTISACISTISTSISPATSTSTVRSSFPTSPWDRRSSPAPSPRAVPADPRRLRPGVGFAALPGQFLDQRHQPHLDLPAPQGLRIQSRTRRHLCQRLQRPAFLGSGPPSRRRSGRGIRGAATA